KKAFQPFGSQPAVGSRFLIGCEEALSKRLLDLHVTLRWQGAPTDFYAWYDGYNNRSRLKNGMSATLTFQDRSGQTTTTTLDLMARDAEGATTLSPSAPPPGPAFLVDVPIFALASSGSVLGGVLGHRFALERPIYQRALLAPPE